MGLHTVAFFKSVTTQGTLQALTPVPDDTVTINGDLLYVPDKYNQLVRAVALCDSAGTFAHSQLQAPSLRQMFYPDVSNQYNSAPLATYSDVDEYSENPVPLVTSEGLEFFSDGGGNGTTASDVFGLVTMGDGPIAMAKGKMRTIRATASYTGVFGTWVNSTLTFDQTLPAGNYDVVGMRVEGADTYAGRLVFIGASAVTRPGVLAVNGANGRDPLYQRYGRMGVLGTFNNVTPPSVEFLGTAADTPVVYLDLIPR